MEGGQPGGNSSRMARLNRNGRAQMTKAVLFASCFWMLVVFSSCSSLQQPTPQPPPAPVADPRVTELENKVAALEKKVEDLQLKGQIVSSILFKLSEQRFLHSTRFWTEVYDSAHASCARNKLEETRIARGNCANQSNESQRQQCFEDVAVAASRGQLFCGNLQ